jgi:long-chain acyl-CoA synthetase
MNNDKHSNSNPITALDRLANAKPRATAFWFQGTAWSYGRFAGEAQALARGFIRLGLTKGSIVAVHMINRPEMLVVYAACMHLGLIVAPLRTAFTTAELLPLLERLRPALYVGEAELYEQVAGASTEVLSIARRYVVGNLPDQRIGQWSELLDRGHDVDVLTVDDAGAPLVLICTSGTTGVPKLVCHTQASLSAIVKLLAGFRKEQADDVTIEHLALAHASGVFTFLTHLKTGVPFILMTFDADAMLDVIARYRCTYLIGFPTQYAAMVERQQVRPRDLSSLRLCLTVGDVCPTELQDRTRTVLGCEPFNFWASSETLGSLTFGVRPGPVCRMMKGADIRLIDPDGNDVPHGEVGEFCVRGANMFAGYWKQPEATAEAIKDGWYHSGDLMRRGDGDEIWFVGRCKDVIIRGATNISPVEVEEAIMAAHPRVKQAVVVGIADAALGQRVVGFVTLLSGRQPSTAEIREAVSKRLAAYKVPEWLIVLPELPLNKLGKLDRRGLASVAQWRDDEERGLRPSTQQRPASA